MKKILMFCIIVVIPFVSFSQIRDYIKNSASEKMKDSMIQHLSPFMDTLRFFNGDFSVKKFYIKKGKIKERNELKIRFSDDKLKTIIELSDSTETRLITLNYKPGYWLGFNIIKDVGYSKDRYQSGYINNIADLDSLLMPIKTEVRFLCKIKNITILRQGEILVKK